MNKQVLNFIFYLFIAANAWAQKPVLISGHVTSASDKEPLPGVTVYIAATQQGTTTDFDGKYSLLIKDSAAIITYSAVGYKTTTRTITGTTSLDIALEEDSKSLEEVVVTAIAIERQKKELGYATQDLKAEEISRASNPNFLAALSGKVAGVQVSNTTGALGGSVNVIIRGRTSLNNGNNQPLYVIDGIPIDNTTASTGGGNITNLAPDFGNPATDINPNDIENITVLKGPTASALYGSRASNGAIMITTKSGRGVKKKMEVTYTSSYSVESVLKTPDVQFEYASGQNGVYNATDYFSWGPKIEGQTVSNPNSIFPGQASTVPLQAYNRYDQAYEHGSTFNNSINLRGSSNTTHYSFSISRLDAKSIIPNTNQARTVFTVKAGTQLSNNITSDIYLSYTNQNYTNLTNGGFGSIPMLLTGYPANIDLGPWKNYQAANGSQLEYGSGYNNPYWALNKNPTTQNRDRVIGNFTLSYKPLPWLSFTSRIGTDFYYDFRKIVYAKYSLNSPNGGFTDHGIFQQNYNADFMMSVSKQLSKAFDLKFLAGYNVRQEKYYGNLSQAFGLIVPNIYTFNNTEANPYVNNYTRMTRLYGVYGNLTLAFKDYLFLDLTARNDWSSTLPMGNNSYLYPSAGLSFVASDAINLIKDSKTISYLKLRTNFSVVGRAPIDPYLYDVIYRPSSQGSSIRFPFGSLPGYSASTNIVNNQLKPEITPSYEFGSEIGLLRDRVKLDFTLYHTQSRNQIFYSSTAPSTGYANISINAGQISNTGFEAMLNIVPILKTSGFKWEATFNYSMVRNNVDYITSNLNRVSQTGTLTDIGAIVGYSFPTIYGRPFLRDPQGRMVINDNGVPQLDSARVLGTTVPDWYGGIRNTFSYKGFVFSFLVDIKMGGKFYSLTAARLKQYGAAAETLEGRNGFTVNGVKQVTDGSGNVSYTPYSVTLPSSEGYWKNMDLYGASELGLYDASFVKLREVSLSYSFGENLLKKTPFGKFTFGVYGRNLLMWTKNPYVDPEINVAGFVNVEGYEEGQVPSQRSFGANLSCTF